jgi:hypothetical protein
MVTRFRDILKIIHEAGGSHQIWSDSQGPAGKEDTTTIV